MKKILLIALLLSLLVAGNSFAERKGWAIGAAFYWHWTESAAPTGAALCVKFPGVPIMFGFSAYLMEPIIIGISADWWLFQTHLVGPVDLYIGPGLFLIINTDPYWGYVDFGLRIPVGFQIFIVKAFEIFLEPALAIHIYPTIPTFGFMGALGLRFWF